MGGIMIFELRGNEGARPRAWGKENTEEN